MKVLLIGIACAIALIAVVVLGLGWWGMNHNIDTSNAQTAEGFRKGFERSCVDGVVKQLAAAGKTATEEQTAGLTKLCDCMADDTIAQANASGGIKISDIALHPEKFAQQMQESGKMCSEKLGIQGN